MRGFGDAEIDDLRDRDAVVERDEDVRGFDVAMDDSFLVRVLDGGADLDEKFQTFARGEFVLVAVFGDARAAHPFHDERRPAIIGGAGIENLRDVWMVHHGERLSLSFEAGDDLAGVHAELYDLESDAAFYRLLLFGHEDYAAAAFAEFLKKLVAGDAHTRVFIFRKFEHDGAGPRGRRVRRGSRAHVWKQ